MRNAWFILCMLTVLLFGITSCGVSEAAQAKINVLLEKQANHSKELELAFESYKIGKLTTGELADLSKAIKLNIDETKAEVKQMRADGMGWGELALATFLGMVARGTPSKGPLAMLLGKFSTRPADPIPILASATQPLPVRNDELPNRRPAET